MKNLLTIALILILGGFAELSAQEKLKKPNIVIIVSDDQGNADAGFQRSPAQVSTPAIDKLASDGIMFTNAYASAYVCAPTRAGLMTGRYQQRFGFYKASDSRKGMPLNEVTIAEVLKKEDYHTGMFGKWHLGLTEEYHPNSRGFDEFYGFLGHGAHDYFDLSIIESNPDDYHQHIYRNLTPISDTGYLTDNLAREASSFIKNKAKEKDPFFLYLPFNAVHTPMQAPEEDIKLFNTGDLNRDIQLAMLHRMDIGIGEVIKTLKEEGVYDNTIIFYFSDNGGGGVNSAINLPLRDFKQSVYEGGLRVPFVISWPDKLKPGTCDEPVISIDVLPTVCAALGIELSDELTYDGRNILSAINRPKKRKKKPLHDQLFFDGDQGSWAVREGDWKLLCTRKLSIELYNLKDDLSEKNNLAEQEPQKVADLRLKYETWRNEMGTPMVREKK
ncbi:MAG: sulfatase-like hydrolase/transferase [Bacteroidetes bacterium]|nr:sulfatase-like hydrolase/transferase [Bacteroidota bacterium]